MRVTLINRLNKEGEINDAGGIASRWWALMVDLVFGNRRKETQVGFYYLLQASMC